MNIGVGLMKGRRLMTPWVKDYIDQLRYMMSERKQAQALRAATVLEQAVQTRWDARPKWFRDLLDKYETESSKYAITVLECLDEYDGEWTSQGVAMALADWAQAELEQCGGLGTSGDDELVGYLGNAANKLSSGTF